MNRSYFLASSFLLSSAAMAQSAPTLSIDPAHFKTKVSPQLYGLMTEEINCSHDGGLYAKMVRNRSIQQLALIVPVESGLKDVASHIIPGYTIQVLELKAQ